MPSAASPSRTRTQPPAAQRSAMRGASPAETGAGQQGPQPTGEKQKRGGTPTQDHRVHKVWAPNSLQASVGSHVPAPKYPSGSSGGQKGPEHAKTGANDPKTGPNPIVVRAQRGVCTTCTEPLPSVPTKVKLCRSSTNFCLTMVNRRIQAAWS